MRPIRLALAALLAALVVAPVARADEQQIAPGTGLQSSVVINTGADGICNTTAALGDIQAAPVGQGTPFRNEVRCGADKIVQTVAAGDDTQLIAVGATCSNANKVVIDTGANGVPESTLAGDDPYVSGIALGVPPANTPCVIAGANGIADTGLSAGDDNQVLAMGTAEANSAVVLCGPNLVADTTANNVNPLGDDVQVVLVGNACATANDVAVDSGPNGIADTRAEGPDLVLAVQKPVKVKIPAGSATGSKTVKVKIYNAEFGASAPASRTYKLTSTNGSCPGGTVTQLDADAAIPGLQATSTVLLGAKMKGTFVVTAHLEDVTSFSTKVPFRCTFNVSVVATDTAPAVDDAANPENNTTTVDLEITDKNDL
jgi:hypothetical protein